MVHNTKAPALPINGDPNITEPVGNKTPSGTVPVAASSSHVSMGTNTVSDRRTPSNSLPQEPMLGTFSNWQSTKRAEVLAFFIDNNFKLDGDTAISLLNTPKHELAFNPSKYLSVFFPSDNQSSDQKIYFKFDEKFCEIFKEDERAKKIQKRALIRLLGSLGLYIKDNKVNFLSDFNASHFLWLRHEQGINNLAQIIRSFYQLNDPDLASSLQQVLISIAINLHLEPEVIEKLSAATNGQSKEDQYPVPEFTLLKKVGEQPNKYRRQTGDFITDFYLGYARFFEHGLKHYILNMNPHLDFTPDSYLVDMLFPTDKPSSSEHLSGFYVSDNSIAGFRQNPLARQSQKIMLDLVLKRYGLTRADKNIILSPNASEEQKAKLVDKDEIECLSKIIKSLFLLENDELAVNMGTDLIPILFELDENVDVSSLIDAVDIAKTSDQPIASKSVMKWDQEIEELSGLKLEHTQEPSLTEIPEPSVEDQKTDKSQRFQFSERISPIKSPISSPIPPLVFQEKLPDVVEKAMQFPKASVDSQGIDQTSDLSKKDRVEGLANQTISDSQSSLLEILHKEARLTCREEWTDMVNALSITGEVDVVALSASDQQTSYLDNSWDLYEKISQEELTQNLAWLNTTSVDKQFLLRCGDKIFNNDDPIQAQFYFVINQENQWYLLNAENQKIFLFDKNGKVTTEALTIWNHSHKADWANEGRPWNLCIEMTQARLSVLTRYLDLLHSKTTKEALDFLKKTGATDFRFYADLMDLDAPKICLDEISVKYGHKSNILPKDVIATLPSIYSEQGFSPKNAPEKFVMSAKIKGGLACGDHALSFLRYLYGIPELNVETDTNCEDLDLSNNLRLASSCAKLSNIHYFDPLHQSSEIHFYYHGCKEEYAKEWLDYLDKSLPYIITTRVIGGGIGHISVLFYQAEKKQWYIFCNLSKLRAVTAKGKITLDAKNALFSGQKEPMDPDEVTNGPFCYSAMDLSRTLFLSEVVKQIRINNLVEDSMPLMYINNEFGDYRQVKSSNSK